MEKGKRESRLKQPEYKDGRTKQSFKKSCDINELLSKARRQGTLSHLQKHGAYYGDFADVDLLSLQTKINKGMEIFGALPAEVRREFANEPDRFFRYVNDPENRERLPELLPDLARPGKQLITPNRGRAEPEATKEPVQDAEASSGEAASTGAGGDAASSST